MHDRIQQISDIGIVPVVKLDHPDQALPLGDALIAGGLPVAEVTFRTDAAEESIRRLSNKRPDVLVGAGTVLSVDVVKRAVDAGAKFIVTPGFNPSVVQYCVERNIAVTPGVNNPSHIEQALEMGLDVVKFFPAEASGGLTMLKALAGPYGDLRYIPTGGITAENMARYLAFDRVLAVGGSWMVAPSLLSAEKYDEITRLSREAVRRALGFELKRVSFACPQGAEQAKRLTDFLGVMLNDSSKEARVAPCLTLTEGIEEQNTIVLETYDLNRARAYLISKGAKGLISAEERDEEGRLRSLTLHLGIDGFSFQLVSSSAGR